jgi:hypothetical protein
MPLTLVSAVQADPRPLSGGRPKLTIVRKFLNHAKNVQKLLYHGSERLVKGILSSRTSSKVLLDPEDHLAAQLARDGDPEEVLLRRDGYAVRHRLERRLSNRLRGGEISQKAEQQAPGQREPNQGLCVFRQFSQ